jgi:hypothetical protein
MKELFEQIFYLDETSPSFLRWKITVSNRSKAGDVAGSINNSGYWRVTYKAKFYPVHKIVYCLHYGNYDESLTVDHIDNCPSNNNPQNLRLLSLSEQNKHRRKWGAKTMDNRLNEFEMSKADRTCE